MTHISLKMPTIISNRGSHYSQTEIIEKLFYLISDINDNHVDVKQVKSNNKNYFTALQYGIENQKLLGCGFIVTFDISNVKDATYIYEVTNFLIDLGVDGINYITAECEIIKPAVLMSLSKSSIALSLQGKLNFFNEDLSSFFDHITSSDQKCKIVFSSDQLLCIDLGHNIYAERLTDLIKKKYNINNLTAIENLNRHFKNSLSIESDLFLTPYIKEVDSKIMSDEIKSINILVNKEVEISKIEEYLKRWKNTTVMVNLVFPISLSDEVKMIIKYVHSVNLEINTLSKDISLLLSEIGCVPCKAFVCIESDFVAKIDDVYKYLSDNKIDELYVKKSDHITKPVGSSTVKQLFKRMRILNKKYSIMGYFLSPFPFCSYIVSNTKCLIPSFEIFNCSKDSLIVDTSGNIRRNSYTEKVAGKLTDQSDLNLKDLCYENSSPELTNKCCSCNAKESCSGLNQLSEFGMDIYARPDEYVKNKRVLMIVPVYSGMYNPCKEPISYEYISGTLKENGFETRIIDFNTMGYNHDALVNYVLYFKPDVICISSFTLQVRSAYLIGSFLKNHFPQISLVYGGMHHHFLYGSYHSTDFPKEPFEKGRADFVVIGDGEVTILNLMNMLDKSLDSFQDIKALCYRNGTDIVITNQKNHIENIDEISFPDRDKLPVKLYNNEIHIKPFEREVAVDIISSRGCPNSCLYCTSPRFYEKKLRVRSVENVIEELEEIYYHHNVKHVHFMDDNFLYDKNRIEKICLELINRNIQIKWICMASIKMILKAQDILPILAKSGCIGIEMGLESPDYNISRKMNKELNLQEYKSVNTMLRDNGIYPIYLTMTMYPGEVIDSIALSSDVMREFYPEGVENRLIDYMASYMNPYTFGVYTVPYTGTGLYENVHNEGISYIKTVDDYNRLFISFIPHSLLKDIPVKVNSFSKDDFITKLSKYDEYLKIYIENTHNIFNLTIPQYKEILFETFDFCDGFKKIEEFNKFDLRFFVFNMRILITMGFIRSLRSVNA